MLNHEACNYGWPPSHLLKDNPFQSQTTMQYHNKPIEKG